MFISDTEQAPALPEYEGLLGFMEHLHSQNRRLGRPRVD